MECDPGGRCGRPARSAVRQEILDDVVAVGLEHHAGAAVLADLLLGPLDHAVALAGHRRLHLAAGGDLEALFSARLGLQLGHFSLLQSAASDAAKNPSPRVCSIGPSSWWAISRPRKRNVTLTLSPSSKNRSIERIFTW